LHGATIAILSSDLIAAEGELRAAYDTYDAMGEQNIRGTVAGVLGRVLYGLERFADADMVTAEAERITPADDVGTETIWRATRAKLLARSGAHERGLGMAESALALSQDRAERRYAIRADVPPAQHPIGSCRNPARLDADQNRSKRQRTRDRMGGIARPWLTHACVSGYMTPSTPEGERQ
jgi:hypothetical protein